MTRKHFVHAARHIACFSKRGTVARRAMLNVTRNLFATYNCRFSVARFQDYVEKLDADGTYGSRS